MKKLVLAALCVATLSVASPATARLAEIEKACRNSKRSASTPKLCRCIQKVADTSLKTNERRRVAKWFADPHQAQVVRQSDRPKDEVLWKRYKAFAEKASKTCR